jgi:hypothetical protein
MEPLIVMHGSIAPTGENSYFSLIGPLQRYDVVLESEAQKKEWFDAISSAITSAAKGTDVGPIRTVKNALVFNSNVEQLPVKYKGDLNLGKVRQTLCCGAEPMLVRDHCFVIVQLIDCAISHRWMVREKPYSSSMSTKATGKPIASRAMESTPAPTAIAILANGSTIDQVRATFDLEFSRYVWCSYLPRMLLLLLLLLLDHSIGGKGTMTFANDSKYIGEWIDGLPHGKGIMIYLTSGEKYEGEWSAGAPSGYGIYTCHSGHRYYGTWSAGRVCYSYACACACWA